MKLEKTPTFLLLCFFLLTSRTALYGQSVGINTSGNAPDPSAMLDVSSTDKGVLIPRVQLDDATTAAPIAAAPVEGLLIYNATGSEPSGYYFWDGSQWVRMLSGAKGINSSLTLNGNSLELTDPGGTLTQDLSSLGTDRYWTRDSSNEQLYPNALSDSVGIGLQDPRAELHIKGKDVDITNNTAAVKIWEQKDGDSLYMDGDEITGGLGGGAGNENALYLQHEASEHVVMSTGSGYVGIGSGANYPGYKLHVQESSSSDELVRFRNMTTGNLSAMGIHGMAIESDGQGIGGEFQGGRLGVHGYVTTSAQYIPDQELTGVLGRSTHGTAAADNVGVKGYVSNSDSLNVGVYGFSLGQDGTSGGSSADPTDYGVYGEIEHNSRNTTWAGYFNGDLAYTGTLSSPSDKRFKRDVRAPGPVLRKLEDLEVYSYNFQRMEVMNLPNGKQYGFMAQEVEEVFPSLIEESVFNASRRGKDNDVGAKSYKALNYIGFIPLLTKAIKEQQRTIEKKEQEIKELQKEVERNDKELKELRSQMEALKEELKEE